METLGPISAEINSPSSSATSESDCSPWIQTGFPSESEKTSFTALSVPSLSDRALNSPDPLASPAGQGSVPLFIGRCHCHRRDRLVGWRALAARHCWHRL